MNVGRLIDWTQQPLGQVDDTSLARALQASVSTVRRARLRYHVPAPIPPHSRLVGTEFESLLGTMIDADVARLAGVATGSVSRIRKSRGISPVLKFKSEKTILARVHRHVALMKIGAKTTSKKIAKALGLEPNQVASVIRRDSRFKLLLRLTERGSFAAWIRI